MIRNVHSKIAFVCLTLLLAVATLPWHTESLSTSSTAPTPQRKVDYATARQTRISHNNQAHGKDESAGSYQKLLEKYPDDATTASHLAATASTPRYQRQVAQKCGSAEFQRFRCCLVDAKFSTHQVGLTLGVCSDTKGKPHRLSFSMSPIYVTPAAAGTLSHDKVDQLTRTPVECLIALFLLGATVSRTRLKDLLGQEFLDLAQSLSLLYPSDSDKDKLLATVQIFPVQLGNSGSSEE